MAKEAAPHSPKGKDSGKHAPAAKAATAKVPKPASVLFEKENITWMIIGGVVVVLGLLLMAGGKSKDPNQFHPDEVYSWRRISLAPVLFVAGLVIEVYAIMKKPKAKQ